MQSKFFALSALALIAVHVNGLAAVGRTPGAFEVSATGEATYTIPIALPPGVNGLTPQIALTYASRSRQAIAGYGWNISGAMAIKRCFSTMVAGQRGTRSTQRFAGPLLSQWPQASA
jgi:hypothetical protein